MSGDSSSFDAYLKNLFRQEACVRDADDALDESTRNLYLEIERLREGYMSLASLARHMAYEGVGCPKRALTPDEDVAYYSVFRQCIRQAKIAVRAGTLTMREPYMLLPVSVPHLQRWLDANDTTESIDQMIDKRFVVKIDEARAWLVASGAKIPGVLGESQMRRHRSSRPSVEVPEAASQNIEPRDPDAQVRNTPLSTETTWRQVGWREAIVTNWSGIVAAYGKSASARDIMRYLKSSDTTGCILPGGASDELTWRTDSGTQRTVSRKTLANAVSQLRVQGRLTT